MEAERKAIREVSLRLLSRREYSRYELFNKLMSRGFDSRQAEAVIANLAEQGWLCDRRFAESHARQRIQKGYGPKRIAYELRQAGIDDFDLDEIIYETAGSWLDLLVQVYQKKYPQERTIPRHEWAKRSRFLLQRGFSGALIGALFDHLNLKFE